MRDGKSRQRAKILTVEPRSGVNKLRYDNELLRAIFAAIYNRELESGDYFAFQIRQEKVFQLESELYTDENGFSDGRYLWIVYDTTTGGDGIYITDPGRRIEDALAAPFKRMFYDASSMYESAGDWLNSLGQRYDQEKERLRNLTDWERSLND